MTSKRSSQKKHVTLDDLPKKGDPGYDPIAILEANAKSGRPVPKKWLEPRWLYRSRMNERLKRFFKNNPTVKLKQ